MTYPKPTSPETTGPIGKPGQCIRGGYLTARRHKESGILIRIASRPFEHASLAEAETQARVLAERHDDEFAVFAQVASVMPPLREAVVSRPEELPLPVSQPLPRPAVVIERRILRQRVTGGKA
ncbi:hypothetical protein [Methylobacterium sp. CM6246]